MVEDELRESILSFLDDYSIEATPHSIGELTGAAGNLNPGTRVYVAHPPKSSHDDLVETVSRLRELGFEAVPHLVARRLRSKQELDRFLEQLASLGVSRALLIAGDLSEPIGSFHSALQVLQTGSLGQHGIRIIGIAGHPDGSQWIAADVIRQSLLDKARFAADNDKDLYIVTQFGFDTDSLIRFETELGNDDIKLEIHAGMAGKTTLTSLLRYARYCGISASAKIFAGTAIKLIGQSRIMSMEKQVVALSKHRLENPESRIVKAHFFPFGDMSATLKWLNAVQSGEFELTPDSNSILITGSLQRRSQ